MKGIQYMVQRYHKCIIINVWNYTGKAVNGRTYIYLTYTQYVEKDILFVC